MESPGRYSFTYYPPRESDGWLVELKYGRHIVERFKVLTRCKAVTAAKGFRDRFPEATFVLCILGEVNAWQTQDGWLYSQTESHPDAIRVLALDDLGDVVLQVTEGAETRFIDGARKFQPSL
ncbi:hypothetical protein [Lacipirellula sp.]|uniref:hypothetical protein n=1 Tax=Lacipirellula sp. TaxID=2691419 RepID=UPI003D134382